MHFMDRYKNFLHHFADPVFIYRVDNATSEALRLAVEETDKVKGLQRVSAFGLLKAYTARMASCARWSFEMVIRWLLAHKGWGQMRLAAGVCLDAEILTLLEEGKEDGADVVDNFIKTLAREYGVAEEGGEGLKYLLPPVREEDVLSKKAEL